MHRPKRLTDLLAFVAVLLTVIVLLVIGVPPESLAIVVVAMGGLYGSWLGSGQSTGREEGGPRSAGLPRAQAVRQPDARADRREDDRGCDEQAQGSGDQHGEQGFPE